MKKKTELEKIDEEVAQMVGMLMEGEADEADQFHAGAMLFFFKYLADDQAKRLEKYEKTEQ